MATNWSCSCINPAFDLTLPCFDVPVWTTEASYVAVAVSFTTAIPDSNILLNACILNFHCLTSCAELNNLPLFSDLNASNKRSASTYASAPG
eukprot:CAMPEP_0113852588 /NCGR_PEP_ID=MMETSP0372-20130328/5635_1 /TAXON_ID=340204 /ORGANISM="Lankesteria abbotti" /LENGTH=91 /DNA_ID=CAMNT_0000824237 /DNA_START=28 /DNA_END=303 /DNA_ORIENTATION=+ /assembly_acc=CAM_ASM_000359